MTRMTLMEGGCSSDIDILSLVKSGNSKALVALLQSKSPPVEELNLADRNGRTCLSYAAENGDVCMVDLLLATDIPDANVADLEGNTPLIYSVSLGHCTVAGKLLKYDTTNIDQANKNGFTALIKAALRGSHSCVDLLIKAGADAELTDHTRHMTALQWAKHCGSQNCIKSLRKCKSHSKKPSTPCSLDRKLTKSASDLTNLTHHQHSSPLKKIRDTFTHKYSHKDHHLGIESIVSCVSTPTIPILHSSADPMAAIAMRMTIEPITQKHSAVTASPKKNSILPSPKIEITTDTGERIIPNKSYFTSTSHIKKH